MNEHLLEVSTYEGIGYKPLIDFESWRVAYLRYIDELEPDNIERAEKHLETDEVFVLLHGQGVLFIGDGAESISEMTAYTLEPCQLYNVKQNAWHNIVLSRDATILLVENRNTGATNTEYCPLTADQKEFIKKTALSELPG